MKKMKALLLILVFNSVAWAHQPDLSMMILHQNEKGQYFLEMSSSLVAFDGEVAYKYGKESYKTPDEFKRLAIRHFMENFSLSFNENQKANIENVSIVLGHETKLLMEVLNVPKAIGTIHIKNLVFSDMPQNQCIVMLSGEKLPKQQYILSNKNNNEIVLRLEGGIWKKKELNENKESNLMTIIGAVLFLALLLGLVIFLKMRQTKVLQFNI